MQLWARTAGPKASSSSPLSSFSVLLAPSLLSQEEKPCPDTKARKSVFCPPFCCLHRQIAQRAAPRTRSSYSPTSTKPPAYTQGRGSCYWDPVTQNSCCLARAATVHPCLGLSSSCARETCFSLWSRFPANEEAPQEVPMKSAPRFFLCLSYFGKSAQRPH